MKGFIFFSSITMLLLMSVGLQAKQLHLKSNNINLKDLSELTLQKASQGMQTLGISSQDIVVQFNAVVTEQNKKDLEFAGFKVLQYLPEDALIVRGSLAKAIQVQQARSDIYAVAPYMSDWKLSEEFQNLSILDQKEQTLIHIRVLPQTNLDAVTSQLKSLNVLAAQGRDILVRANKLQALKIAEVSGVEFIQLAPEVTTFAFNDDDTERDENLGETKTGYESGTKVMNLDKAWERGFTGRGQTVAMADTGLDTGAVNTLHRDLTTVIGGEAVGLFGESWEDPQGHGTHVAGSVVSQGNLSQGLIKGGAYNSSFFAQGMWSPMLNNISVPFDLKGMFLSAANKGARVHTNSWGAVQNLGAYDNFAASVDEFMFNNPETLVIFAAGNSGQDIDKDGVIDPGSVSSPGTAKNTLTVGASENFMTEGGRLKACGEMREGDKKWGIEPLKSDKLSDNADGVACFSSRGPTKDSRIKPEIVAPGTNIVSLRSKHPKATRLWGIYNEEYSWAGGTSMATPLTAGAAAVTREYLQSRGLTSPTAAAVKATLVHTATDIFPGQFGKGQGQEIPTQRPNNVEGYGRVNMDLATNLGTSAQVIDEKSGLATSESKTYSLALRGRRGVRNFKGLRATLVYTDAPAAASSAKTLVNNLDLEVVDPQGKKYSLNDSTNNSEMIEILDGPTGTYSIQVKGINVPQGKDGKQPYALVISPVRF